MATVIAWLHQNFPAVFCGAVHEVFCDNLPMVQKLGKDCMKLIDSQRRRGKSLEEWSIIKSVPKVPAFCAPTLPQMQELSHVAKELLAVHLSFHLGGQAGSTTHFTSRKAKAVRLMTPSGLGSCKRED